MTKKILTIALIIATCMFSLSAYSKFDVKVIYFKPVDADGISVAKHDAMLKDIQQHYQSEMTKHGYEGYTFPLELDESNNLIIHVVEGNHNSKHYNKEISAHADYKSAIEPELPFEFNNALNVDSRDNVLLIILGGAEVKDWNDKIGMGFTWLAGRWGGIATVKLKALEKFPNHYLALIAHEMGHAFALDPGHNGLNDALNGTVIHFGQTTKEWGNRMRLLKHEADLLKSRPIFRKIELADETPVEEKPNKNPELVDENLVEGENPNAISVKPTKLKLTIIWAELKMRK
ncbi:MAG: hypothetical protein OXU51_12720 [Candidatus Poribacteria bacterium]|nr:hypothetical protein [Candidatus Poribacteria bacterium]